MAPAYVVGVDENGLGPQLGPMVVTGVLVEVVGSSAEVSRVYRDSKELCAHGDMARVEALVLATLEVHLGMRPRSYAELQACVGLQDESRLRARCPRGAAPRMCFGAELPLPAFGGAPDAGDRARAQAIRDGGMRLVAASQAYACAGELNALRAVGRSRFDVDLDLMVELVAALRAGAPRDLEAWCGKVGGRKSYSAALTARWPLIATLGEAPARSSYAVPGVGTLHFERDADASQPAVSLASLVGKYARELAMARIHAFFAAHLPELAPASGYHDPVTRRYVDSTRVVRDREGIDDACFTR